MERRDGRASAGSLAERRDQRMRAEPAVQGVAEKPLAFPVHDTHRALAAQERALDERLRRLPRLIPAPPVQVGFRHAAARLGEEQEAFDRVGA